LSAAGAVGDTGESDDRVAEAQIPARGGGGQWGNKKSTTRKEGRKEGEKHSNQKHAFFSDCVGVCHSDPARTRATPPGSQRATAASTGALKLILLEKIVRTFVRRKKSLCETIARSGDVIPLYSNATIKREPLLSATAASSPAVRSFLGLLNNNNGKRINGKKSKVFIG